MSCSVDRICQDSGEPAKNVKKVSFNGRNISVVEDLS
jgi:hypothetical protein